MTNGTSQIAFCPNCQQAAIRSGNEITCEKCDATFTITKKDGAKVKKLGRIELLEKDVAELKARLPDDDEPAELESPAQEPESEPDEPEDDNEDIL